jgi:hypothetical protein
VRTVASTLEGKERTAQIVANEIRHGADTNKCTATSQPLQIQLIVNGQAYAAGVNPREIFHEALEHALPEGLLAGHRIRISTRDGDEVFPDMFIGESVAHFQTQTFYVEAKPLNKVDPASGKGPGTWANFGFDHLAITVADRADAKVFFSEVLGLTIVRDDRHQTVLTTGNTALFLFDAEKAPLSDGLPSRWHHIGFVVDNLDAAYQHLAHHAQLRKERVGSGSIASDFTLLERNERWSLYCHYRNGDTSLMIQLSEIKAENRGFINPHHFSDHMYDYLSGSYGVRFGEEQEL